MCVTAYATAVVADNVCTAVSNVFVSNDIAICGSYLVSTGTIVVNYWLAYFSVNIKEPAEFTRVSEVKIYTCFRVFRIEIKSS